MESVVFGGINTGRVVDNLNYSTHEVFSCFVWLCCLFKLISNSNILRSNYLVQKASRI